MPQISMEIFCLIIVIFLMIMFYNSSQIDKTNPIHTLFSRMAFATFICLVFEMNASYCLDLKPAMEPRGLIVSLIVFFLSFLTVLFICFEYVKRMINLDMPSLKKIGGWTYYVVGGLLLGLLLIPLLSVRILEDHSIVFTKLIYFEYAVFVLFELFIGAIILVNYKYINMKRRKILAVTFFMQIICLAYQAYRPHIFIAGLGITMILISYYMSLESEDVKLIEELAIEKENANLANNAKSQFIANVSHEIRTPINAVLGMDEMILRETQEEKTRQYASDIKSAAQSLHGIINEILDMSKMESGKMEILPVNYNMRSLINDAISIIQMKADTKNLILETKINPEIPAGYRGDEMKIKQILNNILSNAVKYTNTGSITFRLDGERVSNNRAKLHFEIADTGIGMKKEDLEQLFVEFRRFDTEKNREVEGTGLGMSITMQLLSMMDSKLEASSEYGAGSVFSFDLEQEIWDDSALGDFRSYSARKEEKYEKSFEAPNIKVLVVDDNAINRKVFIGLLKETKLLIDEASSGPECINMVKKNRYAIIFMDHMMPDMDGIECYHKLKLLDNNMSKDAKVIMLTANAVAGAKELYLDEGFDDFMAKPIVPEKLEEMIKKYI